MLESGLKSGLLLSGLLGLKNLVGIVGVGIVGVGIVGEGIIAPTQCFSKQYCMLSTKKVSFNFLFHFKVKNIMLKFLYLNVYRKMWMSHFHSFNALIIQMLNDFFSFLGRLQ